MQPPPHNDRRNSYKRSHPESLAHTAPNKTPNPILTPQATTERARVAYLTPFDPRSHQTRHLVCRTPQNEQRGSHPPLQHKHVESTLNTCSATYAIHQSNWTPALQSSEHKTICPPERTSLAGTPQTLDTSLKSSPEPETPLIYIHHRSHEAPQHQASHYTSKHTRPATQALQSHTALTCTQNRFH